jgi:uncharacterized protein (DUF1697 family)
MDRAMTRQIALLRGINVGKTKRMPMARVRELLGEHGYEDVKTYVQSGNIVFDGPGAKPEQVAAKLERELAAEFGFDVPVIVRSRDQLAAVVELNPLGKLATDPKRYHVIFLSGAVEPKRTADIDLDDYAPDTFESHGRELYLWTPDGIHDSKLARTLSDKRLGVTATARNWRTVEKLLELAS